MSKEEQNKAVVGRWFTEFWGQNPNLAVTDEIAACGDCVKHRVFFADEATAIAAGYRPCAVCMPQEYAARKKTRPVTSPSGARKTACS